MVPLRTMDQLRPMTLVMMTYFYLQSLDLLTTIAFLLVGVDEGNPVVRLAMQRASSPLAGLLTIKLVAVGLGVYCWVAGRRQLVLRVNYAYGMLIIWNLMCLVLALLQMA